MRKIERDMIQAIHASASWRQDNTQVFQEADGAMAVVLHGNAIARVYPRGLAVTLAGWNTPTTRSRVNRILEAFGSGGITTKLGQPIYFRGRETLVHIGERDWVVLGEVPANMTSFGSRVHRFPHPRVEHASPPTQAPRAP